MKAGGKSFQGMIRGVVVAGFTALLLACGSDSPEKLMSSAKDYLAKGDSKAAVIQLRNLVGNAPNNGEARLLLGQALLDGGEYASAEKELRRALDLFQPPDQALPPYARALLAQGKYKELVAEIPGYKLSTPTAVAAVRTLLGDAQMQLGNNARARDAYAAALAAFPGYPRARLGEAILIATEGRLDEALKAVDEVIAADPKLAEAHNLRADILLAKGDRDGSKKALQAGVAANERYLPARLSLISLLTDDRDFEGAAKLIESTKKLAPQDLRVTYLESALAYRRGDKDKARQQAQQVLKYLPEHVPTLVLAGAIELDDKKYSAAEPYLRKAVAKAPSHVGARQLLAQTYLRMGQPVKARDALQPLVDSGLPAIPQLQLLAGEIYLASGDVQRATAFYQEAAKGQSSQQVAARTRLGQIALASGRSEEGFRELETASELDPGTYQADLALIAGHLRRNEFDKALEAVRALEKKQPNSPLTFQMYGVVNLAKNDFAAARKSFDKALELQPNYLPAAYSLAQLDAMQKKPEDARKRYEGMIARERNNEQLYIALADFLVRTGAEPREVAATLQRAVDADPQATTARLALIGFLMRSGEAKAALNAAQAALAVAPSDPRLLAAAGTAQEMADEINQSIGTFSKLAALQPETTMPLYRIAALRLRQNDADGAIQALRQAQKIAPSEREAVVRLVQIYVAAGRYDEALKEARQLQGSEPKSPDGWALEGDIYFSQRKYAEAERMYREALTRDPKAAAVAIQLHNALASGGKGAEAAAWAKKWIAENPRDVGMRLYLGERELMAKNLKASAGYYQAAIAIDRNNALALNNLAWIGGETGDPKALGYAESAVKLAPGNASILDTYGMLLVKKGEAAKGLPYLERAVKAEPARNDLRLNYAKGLIGAGKKDEARKELQALQGVKADFPGKDEVGLLLKGL
jgi:putative PEP-CTERM system TPR-repeat lipoprotein